MAVKILTINELMNLFSQFSEAHFMLNDWGNGPTSEIGTSRQMKFPYLWATYRNSSTINVQNRTSIPTMNLSFLVVDQINNQANIADSTDLNSDNQQEILSDTFQVCQDLIQFISTELKIYGVTIGEASVNMEPVFDETDDKVTGWLMDIPLIISHYNCVIPLSGFTGYSPLTTPVQPAQFLTCETVTLCESLGLFVDNKIAMAISGITSANYYTTGATLNGNVVSFNRNDTLNAYSVDLSTLSPDLSGYLPLSGGTLTGALSGTSINMSNILSGGTNLSDLFITEQGTSGNLWSASTGPNSIINNNGTGNIASGNQSAVLNGYSSTASGPYSTVVGGYQNLASGYYSTTVGGSNNESNGSSSSVIGGGSNTSSGQFSAVIGGTANIASGAQSAAIGGRLNNAVGLRSVVIGGVSITGTTDDTVYMPNAHIIGDLTATTISATTYLNLPTDIRVTGGTYTNGTALFTNNIGGTFSVSGFGTGSGTAFTGGTVTGATDFTNGLTANTISATTISILTDLWTIELMDSRVATFYAPYGIKFNSITNILNSPTIDIYDDGVAYTLTNTIASGSKIVVSADTASVITLNGTRA